MSLPVEAPRQLSRGDEHRFFLWLAVAIFACAVAGFSRTYFLVPALGLPEDGLPFTPLVHLHAALSFGWCALFVAQCWLVASGRTPQHRRLGVAGVGLFAALVLTGPFVATRAAARAGATPEELAFLAVSAGNILAYSALFAVALLWRRQAALHKRFMVLGMVAMLSAPFGRVFTLPYQLDHVAGPGLVVLALGAWELRSLGRLHLVTAVGGPAVLLWQVLPNAYMHSAWWLQTARWLLAAFAG